MHSIGDRTCLAGHKFAKDLAHCERCGRLLSYPYNTHVNSRDRAALLEAHGMKWLPYTLHDYGLMMRGDWDINIYPWERRP